MPAFSGLRNEIVVLDLDDDLSERGSSTRSKKRKRNNSSSTGDREVLDLVDSEDERTSGTKKTKPNHRSSAGGAAGPSTQASGPSNRARPSTRLPRDVIIIDD